MSDVRLDVDYFKGKGYRWFVMPIGNIRLYAHAFYDQNRISYEIHNGNKLVAIAETLEDAVEIFNEIYEKNLAQ